MKLSGLATALSTLLPLAGLVTAEPIPAPAIAKRELDLSDPYTSNGFGTRYWAWAKLAYDYDYNGGQEPNTEQTGKALANVEGKAWGKLLPDREKIFVKGYSGRELPDGMFTETINTGMKGIVATDESRKVIVMGFIGSNDIETFVSDFKFDQVGSNGIHGQVSKGFYECFDSVYNKLFDWTTEYAAAHEDWDIVITGHSLGGATAHVAAAKFASLYQGQGLTERTYVFTYGAPRAGDLAFQTRLGEDYGDRMWNFRHKHDGVPFLPFIHQSFTNTFANPARRVVFEAKKGASSLWHDASNWDLVAGRADKKRAGLKAFPDILARNLVNGGAQHKEYFSDGPAPKKRDVDVKLATRHQKRGAPSQQDRIKAEEALTRMRSNGDLRRAPEWTPDLEKFASSLGLFDRQESIMKGLDEAGDEKRREAFLRFTEAFAMEHE